MREVARQPSQVTALSILLDDLSTAQRFPFYQVECGNEGSSGISWFGLRLPLMLHLRCHRTDSD